MADDHETAHPEGHRCLHCRVMQVVTAYLQNPPPDLTAGEVIEMAADIASAIVYGIAETPEEFDAFRTQIIETLHRFMDEDRDILEADAAGAGTPAQARPEQSVTLQDPRAADLSTLKPAGNA